MVQAAAAGVIDFTRADPRDRRWWVKLNLILDQLELSNQVEVHALNHRTTTALLSRADLTDTSIDRLRDNAETLVTRVKERYFPWIEFDQKKASQQAIAAMNEAWVRTWGDPADPATQARIDATVAAMERQLQESRRAA